MVAEALDVVLQLGSQQLEEPLRARVDGAAEHQILPDQDALAVAQLVEDLALVLAAAPDAQHVHVRAHRRADEVLVALRRLAGHQRVARYPVGSLAEDVGAIDADDEGLAVVVAFADDLHGTQSELDGLLVAVDGGGEGIERLVAVAGGPPEARVRDLELLTDDVDAGLEVGCDGLGLAVEGEGDGLGAVLEGGDLGDGGDGDLAVAVALFGVEVVDARLVDGGQADVLVDAGDDEGDAPVPAAVADDLADEVVVADDAVAAPGDAGDLGILSEALRLGGRRPEGEGDGVDAGVEERAHLGMVGAEGVGGLQDDGAIEAQRAERVRHGVVEEDGAAVQERLVHGELALECPFVAGVALNLKLVLGVVGVGDDVGVEEGGVGVAGEGGGDGGDVGAGGGGEAPFAIEQQALVHGDPSCAEGMDGWGGRDRNALPFGMG